MGQAVNQVRDLVQRIVGELCDLLIGVGDTGQSPGGVPRKLGSLVIPIGVGNQSIGGIYVIFTDVIRQPRAREHPVEQVKPIGHSDAVGIRNRNRSVDGIINRLPDRAIRIANIGDQPLIVVFQEQPAIGSIEHVGHSARQICTDMSGWRHRDKPHSSAAPDCRN